jgi:fatty acid synthase subunit beta
MVLNCYSLTESIGFAISDIVKRNPKELTVHFGGRRGARIRETYLRMTYNRQKIFKGVTEASSSYTFSHPNGLLFATQFAQPALTIMEKAIFEDMRSKGLVSEDSIFAGHSLGEYSALSSIPDMIPLEKLVSIVFFRGLVMHSTVSRDETGHSNYGMMAVNCLRVSKCKWPETQPPLLAYPSILTSYYVAFTEATLKRVVQAISRETGGLLEIVNFNVEMLQYVCAGELALLDCLGSVCNAIKNASAEDQKLLLEASSDGNGVSSAMLDLIRICADKVAAKPRPLKVERGVATIPIAGIDVPFHSSFLRTGLEAFREVLLRNIHPEDVDPQRLIGKYVPNLTAEPFDISRESFQRMYELTKSDRIKEVLDNWETYGYDIATPV